MKPTVKELDLIAAALCFVELNNGDFRRYLRTQSKYNVTKDALPLLREIGSLIEKIDATKQENEQFDQGDKK